MSALAAREFIVGMKREYDLIVMRSIANGRDGMGHLHRSTRAFFEVEDRRPNSAIDLQHRRLLVPPYARTVPILHVP